MLTLGIETTCDDTAISVVESGTKILSNVIASQGDLHAAFGGVFPEVASRHHVGLLIPVLEKALKEADVTLQAIDLIAVANGPGLMGSILTGLSFAKGLSVACNLPLIGVNHVEAHLYSAMMPCFDEVRFPALGVVISGGHTHLIKMNDINDFEVLGCTQDDAIGESFDKVGALLNLPYPAGPHIEALASHGDPARFSFKAGTVKNHPLDFSYSGLKTQVLYAVKGTSQKAVPVTLDEGDKKHLAAAFQKVVFEDLIQKILKAAKQHELSQIFLGGGVSGNRYLRRELTKLAPPTLSIHFPGAGLSVDNGAMIAGLGYQKFIREGSKDPLLLKAASRMPFSKAFVANIKEIS
jgi:N6-L-threonylcarbamoyladenine synthase